MRRDIKLLIRPVVEVFPRCSSVPRRRGEVCFLWSMHDRLTPRCYKSASPPSTVSMLPPLKYLSNFQMHFSLKNYEWRERERERKGLETKRMFDALASIARKRVLVGEGEDRFIRTEYIIIG